MEHGVHVTKIMKIGQSYCSNQKGAFLPRDASAERGNAIVSRPSVCLSVCPSVCLWRLGISNT